MPTKDFCFSEPRCEEERRKRLAPKLESAIRHIARVIDMMGDEMPKSVMAEALAAMVLLNECR